jgi:hypothetical protein
VSNTDNLVCDGCEMVEDNCLCAKECDQCGGDIEGWKNGRLCWTCDRARYVGLTNAEYADQMDDARSY